VREKDRNEFGKSYSPKENDVSYSKGQKDSRGRQEEKQNQGKAWVTVFERSGKESRAREGRGTPENKCRKREKTERGARPKEVQTS